jgi:hypothetical protein
MEENTGRDSAAPDDTAENPEQEESRQTDPRQAPTDEGVSEASAAEENVQPEATAGDATEVPPTDDSLDGGVQKEAVVEDSPASAEGEEEAAEGEAATEATEAVGAEEEAIPRMESAEPQGADDTPVAPVSKARIPWWPYLVYFAAWLGVVGAAFYVISYEPEALPAFQQDDYPYILLAGLTLTVMGPLLSFVVWLVKWLRTPKGERGGLLTAALVKGALVTFLGVLVWWGAMVMLDALRLGVIEPII